MADAEGAPEGAVEAKKPSRVSDVTSLEDLQNAVSDESKIQCVLVTSKDCPLCPLAKSTVEEMSLLPENNGIDFFWCDADFVPTVAQWLEVGELPSLSFYNEGKILDSFTGGNMEKLKIMAKACCMKRAEAIRIREKAKEEEARLAAQAAAAAAAENAEGEPVTA